MSMGYGFRRARLRTKIITATTMVIILTTVVASGFFYIRTKAIFYENLDKRGRTICLNLGNSAKYGILTEDTVILNELVEGVMQAEDVVYVVIQNNEGKTLVEKTVEEIPEIEYLKKKSLLGEQCEIIETRTAAGDLVYNVSTPVITRKVSLAEMGGVAPDIEEEEELTSPRLRGTVMVGLSLRQLLIKLRDILRGVIILTLLIIAAGVAVSIGFVRLIMTPIVEMASAAVKVTSGDLTQTVKVEAEDEIGEFASQFNAMTASLRRREKELEESYNELNDYKNRLEEMVEARTRELQRTQAELARKEKLAAVGQLAAGVGHELRNPLTAIKNSVYYLKNRMKKEDAKVEKHLGIMEKEIRASNKIISDLLGFSRLGGGEDVPIDINRVVEDTFTSLSLPESLQVVMELAGGLPPVKGDADQIKQVFLNMVLNASQAMTDGGELKIVTRKKGDFVEVEFADNGCGIPEENLGRIFDPFFTTKAKGIGMGLAVCYGIVERHGGTIEVSSTEGEGTTFVVRLPVSGGREP